MRIKNLQLKNIGPFKEAEIDFINGNIEKPSVTIITGENGTGKTIVLDAIRGLLMGSFGKVERKIVRNGEYFSLETELFLPTSDGFQARYLLSSSQLDRQFQFNTSSPELNSKFIQPNTGNDLWIVKYWNSNHTPGNFEINNLIALKPGNYLLNALSGIQQNTEVTELICFFDYLKSSDNPKEKNEGEFLFEVLKRIIRYSLLDGEFLYVERRTLTPIVSQLGIEVSLEKLSSGNLYLVQRLVSLLGQMYSVYLLNNTKLEELCHTPGLLLIDEAENHLHPKWQKTFLNSILDIFPNLQIIVTTHSPFIVSSHDNANIYVCKSMIDHSIIENRTSEYSNKPVEEILLSPVFDTGSFSTRISNLIMARKKAILVNDHDKVSAIEVKLKQLNPDYFSYLDVDDILQSIVNQ